MGEIPEVTERLYLLWNSQAWGVYDYRTCPDPHGVIPPHFYKEYEVPRSREREVFRKLAFEIMPNLVENKIRPSKENYDTIFPKLEDLMK